VRVSRLKCMHDASETPTNVGHAIVRPTSCTDDPCNTLRVEWRMFFVGRRNDPGRCFRWSNPTSKAIPN
jgi:hypothetical protein